MRRTLNAPMRQPAVERTACGPSRAWRARRAGPYPSGAPCRAGRASTRRWHGSVRAPGDRDRRPRRLFWQGTGQARPLYASQRFRAARREAGGRPPGATLVLRSLRIGRFRTPDAPQRRFRGANEPPAPRCRRRTTAPRSGRNRLSAEGVGWSRRSRNPARLRLRPTRIRSRVGSPLRREFGLAKNLAQL